MEEVNREKVIKALELHSKLQPCMEVCPYGGDNFCGGRMAADALKLVKELIEENERLREQLETVKADTVRKIHTQIHNQAVYPSAKGDFAYIQLKTLDGILRNYLNKG